MPLSVDWTNKFITIPKLELTLISGTRYKITVAYYWQLLREANAAEEGIPFDTMYNSTAATSSTPQIVDLINGYTAEFEDGLYSVEFINGNTNFREVEVKNQVSVGTNNTTGFIDPTFLESGLFIDGAVHIDTVNGVAGTDKTPAGGIIGTRQTPSNNIADSKQICLNRGLNIINFITPYTIVDEDLSTGYALTGDSPFLVLDINPAADVTNCSVELLTLQGEMDGLNRVEDCRILNITAVSGMLHKIALAGNVTISGPTLIMESYSNWTGEGHTDFVVGSNTLEVRDFHGSFGVSLMTGGVHSIGITEGRLIVDANCTGGTIYLRGTPYEVVDNSNGAVTIINQTLSKKVDEIHGQVTRSIYIDTELVLNGNGYQQTPYNNWTDAVDDAEANGIKNLVLLADATIDRQLKNFVITGIGTPIVDFNGQNVDKSEFSRCTLTGLYIGRIVAQASNLTGTFNLNGFFENCAFGSNFVIPDNGIAFVKNCSAFVVGADIPTFDIGGALGTGVLSMSGWAGPLKIINVNQATDEANLAINISKAELDASCTDGVINVGGVIRLTDNSNGSVVTNDVIDPQHFQNIFTRLGLEKGNAWTDTPAQSGDASGGIIINNTGDGETSSTGTRQ